MEPPEPPREPSGKIATSAPLAERLRPKTLDEVVGQAHLLGEGQSVRVAFESGQPHSMILWGPPGVGKTTLARLIARSFEAQFLSISAVLGGVNDIRETVLAQRSGLSTTVFVDEVYRFKKAVNCYIKQRLKRVMVQIIGLPSCFGAASRG